MKTSLLSREAGHHRILVDNLAIVATGVVMASQARWPHH